MHLNNESKAFHYSVYKIISRIPHAKVTTYGKLGGSFARLTLVTNPLKGHIAYLVGKPQNSRQVGSSLKHAKMILECLHEDTSDGSLDTLNIDVIPWWRVLLSSGKISSRENTTGMSIQRRKLQEEGIIVLDSNYVDLERHGWFPD